MYCRNIFLRISRQVKSYLKENHYLIFLALVVSLSLLLCMMKDTCTIIIKFAKLQLSWLACPYYKVYKRNIGLQLKGHSRINLLIGLHDYFPSHVETVSESFIMSFSWLSTRR